MALSVIQNLYLETGLKSWTASSADTKLLCLLRHVRFFAFGGVTLVLALFLSSLHVSEQRIGLFMTLTLLGDVMISLILTVVADRIGRRRMLALGSILMTVSGVVFALSSNYWVLVIAAVLGVISPSGNEVGPFKAIEESTISHLIPFTERSAVLAWYMLGGTLGSGGGIIVFGWMVQLLQTKHSLTPLESYRIIFWVYATLGLLMTVLSLTLSIECEVTADSDSSSQSPASETSPLLTPEAISSVSQTIDDTPRKATARSEFLNISSESKVIVFKLCLLLGLDSLASGLAPASWMTYYFNLKFHLSEGRLGSLFSVAAFLSSASNLLSSPLTRRIGLIKTMVFTHVPASLALAAIPLSNNVGLAVTFLLLRASVNSMDQAPRQAFLAAAVKPSERTVVMGVINVIKTLSQTAGPYVTGTLASKGLFGVAFVIAGALKILYDILMLVMFLGYRTIEERAQECVEEETPRERETSTGDSHDAS